MVKPLIIPIFASLLLAAGPARSETTAITRNSRIVVDTTTAADVKAAEDLADYLQRITGRKLAVEDQSEPGKDRYTIAVGENDYARELTEQLQEMDRDGFIIKSAEDRLLIRGYNSRATHFGVSYFLQKYCGVRWYLSLPGNLGTVIPKQEEISLSIFANKQEPSFGIREFGLGKEWIFRNLGTARRWFVQHEFHWRVMPMATYYKEHPEYYTNSLPGWFQPCTSNPEVIQLCIDAAVQYFNKNPDSYAMPMGLNDGESYCQCADCLAAGNTVSDRLYSFYDKVVRGLHEKHPGKKIGVLVYAGIKDLPSPEVMERIDLGHLAGGLPWDRTDWFVPEARAAHQERIRSWSEKLDRFFLWDWFTFRSVSVPTMNIRVIDSMVKFARDLGNCDGMLNQTGPAYVLHGPHMWVYAQLLWNADRDIEELFDDFCSGMFGKGGRWMKEYYNLIQEVWWRQKSSEVALWGKTAAQFALFDGKDMRELRRCLDSAALASDTDDDRARVGMIADSFRAFELAWQLYQMNGQAESISPLSSEKDAETAQAIMEDMLRTDKALIAFREEAVLERQGMEVEQSTWLPKYWTPPYSVFLPHIYRYFAAKDRLQELLPYLERLGAEYADFEAGRLAGSLAERIPAGDVRGGLLFRATFDKGLDADFSRGSAKANHNTNATRGKQGKIGEAAILRDGHYLVYKGKDNVNPRQGAVLMWVKPDHGSNGYLVTIRSEAGLIISWGSGLRTFDTRPHHIGDFRAFEWVPPEEWQGRWHEVGFSYDLDEGIVQIIHNGKVVRRGGMAVPDLTGTDVSIGVGHYVGMARAYFGGLIDDVRIYSSYLDYLLDTTTPETDE